MLNLSCPMCKSDLQVPEGCQGRWITCTQCGSGFAAVAPRMPQDTEGSSGGGYFQSAQAAPAPYVPVYTPQPSRINGCIIAAIVGIFALTGFIFLIAVIAANHSEPERATAIVRQPVRASLPVDERTTNAASAAAGGIFLLLLAFLGIAYLASWILIMAWIARDAKNRGIDGGAVWVLMAFFFHILTLLVYLASRPSGQLTHCQTCYNKRLSYSKTCPHCGHA